MLGGGKSPYISIFLCVAVSKNTDTATLAKFSQAITHLDQEYKTLVMSLKSIKHTQILQSSSSHLQNITLMKPNSKMSSNFQHCKYVLPDIPPCDIYLQSIQNAAVLLVITP